MIALGGANKKAAFLKLEANKALGGFSEESLSALKLIIAFGNEDIAMEKYKEKAEVTRSISFKANRLMSIFFGILRFLMFGFFAYNYSIATIFVENQMKNPNPDGTCSTSSTICDSKPYTIVEIVAVT